ncbi:uncharacterized protein EI90DRAFT_3032610 [Cantharellus anzutake]|uniref:uncharacterized protein n=1 Tax=Cantharellus anzutake TaxID=1750568 RepID=UPI0019041492|nr:uncharacterized protein EI90DRAFT_3032610 [Cantharellus anzutake]KAF8342247.1 hypothetical protein EI90DRAFT_3032610 [Cantharellus anzutake]
MTATSVHDILGGAFSGQLLAAVFFGIITIQVRTYFSAFPKDSLYIKLAVSFLWVIQGLLVACTTQALYWYLVVASTEKNVLPFVTWEMAMHQTMTVVSSTAVQSFFAYRVYALSTSRILGCLVELLSLAQFGLGISSAYRAYHLANFSTIPQQERWLIGSWLLMEVICDVTLAVSMTILLRRQRTGFKQTDNILNKLIVYSINTGTVTGVIAIVICVAFAINGFGFVVLLLGIPFGAVYNFTMLANLHYRTQLRQHLCPAHMRNTGTGPNCLGVKVTVDKTVEPSPSRHALDSRSRSLSRKGSPASPP